MFWFIYHLPLRIVATAICVSPIVWALIMQMLPQKCRRYINYIFAFISLIGVIYITLMRSSSEERELILIPFHSFIEALEQREMYRSVLMNVALFVPFGLTAPYVLCKTKKPVIYTILAAFSLSLIIEIIQFVFCLGRCETDDVIFNTLGAAIGSLSYLISEKLNKCRKLKRNMNI